jgi:hypothetical protein
VAETRASCVASAARPRLEPSRFAGASATLASRRACRCGCASTHGPRTCRSMTPVQRHFRPEGRGWPASRHRPDRIPPRSGNITFG